jgi:hypothetical protein
MRPTMTGGIGAMGRLALGVLVPVVGGCDDPVGPYVGSDAVGRVHVALGSDPTEWRADPLILDSARIEGDTLVLEVTHGGGCADHEYAVVAWNGWLESHPVQVGALVAHDGHDDPCDGLLSPTLRFDLRPLKDAYRDAYGPGAAILIIRLSPPGGPVLSVEYRL